MVPHKLPGGQSQAASHGRPVSADGLRLERGESCHVTPRAIFRGFTSSTWAPSRDGPGTSISQCYDKTSSHGRQPLSRACPRGWTPGCSDQPPGGPPSREAGMAAGVAGAGGTSRTSAGRCPGTHPVDLAAQDPPLPALLLWATPFGPALGHSSSLRGPRPRTAPPGRRPPAFLPALPLALPGLRGPHCPPGRDWILSPRLSAASGLGAPLPSPLHPLTPLAPRPAVSPAKWPLLWHAQLSKLGNKPDTPPPHLPATCPATFGALRRVGHEQRDSRGRVLSLSPRQQARAAWPHPLRLLRAASVLSSKGRKEL